MDAQLRLLFIAAAFSLGAGVPSIARSEDAARAAKSCPEGWTGPHHSSCFKMINEPATWLEANSNGCGEQDSRAHLAAITADNRAFLSKQLSFFEQTDYYWVGLRSTDDKWNSGTQFAVDVDYTNWETAVRHDPDGTAEENDNCVAVAGRLADPSFQPVGGWADASCTDKAPYACDKPQQNGACEDGWVSLSGRCFKLVTEPTKSWEAAKAACPSDFPGSRLAVVDFDLTQDPSSPLLNTYAFWVGLKSTPSSDGNLYWSTSGNQVTETHWLSDKTYTEPNGSAQDNCVFVAGLTSDEVFGLGDWGDMGCDLEKKGYLCQLEV